MPEFPADVLELLERVSDPGATADRGKAYTKDVAGVTQLFYQASDGTVAQATPVLPNPGSISYSDRKYFLTIGPGNTIPASSTAPVPIFATPGDEATLAANSTYQWTLHAILTNTPQSTKLSLSFLGTATYSVFNYSWYAWTSTHEYGMNNSPAATTLHTNDRASPFVVTAEGSFRTSGAGTIIPTIAVLTAQSTPMLIRAGSFMELLYLGSDTFVSQGGWG